MFRKEALKEIKDIQARILELREKFTESHDPSPDKSFLKQKLDQYLDCLPECKADKLEQLMTKDKEIITVARQNVQKQVEKIRAEYQKHMEKDIENFKKQLLKQNEMMFGTLSF